MVGQKTSIIYASYMLKMNSNPSRDLLQVFRDLMFKSAVLSGGFKPIQPPVYNFDEVFYVLPTTPESSIPNDQYGLWRQID